MEQRLLLAESGSTALKSEPLPGGTPNPFGTAPQHNSGHTPASTSLGSCLSCSRIFAWVVTLAQHRTDSIARAKGRDLSLPALGVRSVRSLGLCSSWNQPRSLPSLSTSTLPASVWPCLRKGDRGLQAWGGGSRWQGAHPAAVAQHQVWGGSGPGPHHPQCRLVPRGIA